MIYVATGPHRSEFPEPISVSKGALMDVGEQYQGPENWENWYFCTVPGHSGGWVPAQIIERLDERQGRALDDYTARELDVNPGDVLIGAHSLNGWMWCRRPDDGQSGWVPVNLLRLAEVG